MRNWGNKFSMNLSRFCCWSLLLVSLFDQKLFITFRYALKQKKRYYLGIFPNMGGGLPKSQNFCKFEKQCLFGSKTVFFGQEVHYYMVYIAYFIFHIAYFIFFWIRGSQKGWVGGGSDVWEKFPNNIVFFFESVPYSQSIHISNMCNIPILK